MTHFLADPLAQGGFAVTNLIAFKNVALPLLGCNAVEAIANVQVFYYEWAP